MVRELGQGSRAHSRYHNTSDREFLAAVTEIIQAHIGDPGFDTSEAAQEMSMSRMHLHRKLRALTGCSTRQYITARRLERALQMLGGETMRECDVAGRVGFRSPSYFARAFARIYGIYPSEFARRGDGFPGTADA